MEPTNELLVCRDVSLGYEGQSVLEHLDLTIRRGDYLCIVGGQRLRQVHTAAGPFRADPAPLR